MRAPFPEEPLGGPAMDKHKPLFALRNAPGMLAAAGDAVATMAVVTAVQATANAATNLPNLGSLKVPP
jgi:hypothetical protein